MATTMGLIAEISQALVPVFREPIRMDDSTELCLTFKRANTRAATAAWKIVRILEQRGILPKDG